MHSLIAVFGALVAAVGSGVLLARFFRTPRGDLIAWSIGLLGLLVSLGAQAMGYLSGFDPAMFRAMEIGGQVIAPLAFILALSEVAGKSTAARFCARLYLPALGIVVVVVLALDQLTTARFSKAWPPPFTFYQSPPNYLLEFGIGPVTALITVIAVATILSRSSEPSWHEAVPGALLGGGAAVVLAYPGLAQLVTQGVHTKIHLPLGSVFSILCALAAALAWIAGLRTARLSLADLQGGSAEPDPRDDRRGYRDPAAASGHRGPDDHGHDDGYAGGRYDRTDGHRDVAYRANGYRANGYRDGGYADPAAGGVRLGGGLYRPERPGQETAGSRADEWDEDPLAGGGYADFATGDFDPAIATGDFQPTVLPGGSAADKWQSNPDGGRLADHGDADRSRAGRAAADQHDGDPADRSRADLFGQITIYTLIEDRVAEFDQLTDGLVEQVRNGEPDTLVFIAHAVPSAPTQRILYEVYRSRSAYQRHLAQPYLRQVDVARRPYVLATNVVELGLQQAKVSPFPSVSQLFPEPGYDTSGFERPDYLRDYGRKPAQPDADSRDYR